MNYADPFTVELLVLLLAAFVAGTVDAVANGSGSVAGTWLALRHGCRFVRQVFLVLVAVLIVKFARDTLMPFL